MVLFCVSPMNAALSMVPLEHGARLFLIFGAPVVGAADQNCLGQGQVLINTDLLASC